MLALKFHLTEQEYFEYNYYTAWASPERKMYRLWYYLRVFLLYSAIAILYILSNHSHNMVVDFSIFGSIAIVYFLMVPYLVKRSIQRRVKQVLAQPENRHILDQSEVTVTDTGIIDKDLESESKYSWDAIVKKAETPGSYFLYTNSYHAIVIPKRVLEHDGEKHELERLMNEHLSLSSEFSV